MTMRANSKSFLLNLGKDYLTFATVLSMRPIHRPIHELATLPEVWDKMSPDEQTKARAEGKIRLPVREVKFLTYSYFVFCFVLIE